MIFAVEIDAVLSDFEGFVSDVLEELVAKSTGFGAEDVVRIFGFRCQTNRTG